MFLHIELLPKKEWHELHQNCGAVWLDVFLQNKVFFKSVRLLRAQRSWEPAKGDCGRDSIERGIETTGGWAVLDQGNFWHSCQ